MKHYIVLLSAFYLLAHGLPYTEDEEEGIEGNEVHPDDKPDDGLIKNCYDVFSEHGMNYSSFNKGVAHRVHSLSLEEIRHFFKAEATEENGIPTVNTDFRAENSILYNAPLWGYNDRFATWAEAVHEKHIHHARPTT